MRAFIFDSKIRIAVMLVIIGLSLSSIDCWACLCAVGLPRENLSDAALVVEGTVIDTYVPTIKVDRKWVGNSAEIIFLEWINRHRFGDAYCCYPNLEDGQKVLVYAKCIGDSSTDNGEHFTNINCPSNTVSLAENPEYLEYLEHPKTISRKEVVAILKRFAKGKMSIPDFSRKIHHWQESANVDDWKYNDVSKSNESLINDILWKLDIFPFDEKQCSALLDRKSLIYREMLPRLTKILSSRIEDTAAMTEKAEEIIEQYEMLCEPQ